MKNLLWTFLAIAVLFVISHFYTKRIHFVGLKIIELLKERGGWMTPRNIKRDLEERGVRVSYGTLYVTCRRLTESQCLVKHDFHDTTETVRSFKLKAGAESNWK